MNPDIKSRSSSGNAKIIDVEEYRKNHEGLEIIPEEEEDETGQRQYQKSKQYILSVLLLSCGTWVVMTLVPTHDLIKYPEYWWEIMVQWCFGNKLMKLIFYSLHCKSVLNYPGISSPKSMLKLFIISAALTITYCCVVHLIWTTYLGYYEPMIYNGWLEGLISQFVLMAAVWFLLPKKWRSDPNKRQQMNFYFFYWLFEFTLVYQIFGFLMLIFFPKIPKDFKPYGLALFFWPWREAVGFVMSALIKKAASSDKFDEATLNAVGIMNIDLSTLYHFQALMLCTNLSHVFGDVFTYCLLSADFVFVLITIARIIRIKRKIRPTKSQNMETKELMYELVVSEIVELLVPILFMITFTITYYGPNANHMEGFRHSYWQARPVEDLWSTYYPTSFLFLGFDLIVLVSMAIILYFACNSNLMQEAQKAWMNFGLLITLRLILQWDQVRCYR